MSSVEAQFEAAAAHFAQISSTASDKDKLVFYALWNQAKNGDVDLSTEPSKMNMVAHYKFAARKRVRGMTKEQAMKKYVQELHRVDPKWRSGDAQTSATEEEDGEDEDDDVGHAAGFKYTALPSNKTELERVKPTFELAVKFARSSGLFKSQATRSILYAYYKSSTVGPCTKPAPSIFKGRKAYAKWRAWSNNFDMKPEEAMRRYVDLVRKVAPEFEAKDPNYFMTAGGKGAALFRPTSLAREVKQNGPVSRPTSNAEIFEAMDKVRTSDTGGLIYLITGATGFIGQHLVRRLLELRPTSLFICITRASSTGGDRVHYAFPQHSNVVSVTGDLERPMLGLSKDMIQALQLRGVNHLFHLAAVYDLKASREENERANVLGTRETVALCNALGAGTMLQYTSSIAVAGDYDGIFTEEMFNEGQSFDHDYLRTKYLAEQVVREECKTPYRIYRPGLVLGSSETGEANKIDGPYYLFKPLQHLSKVCPRLVTLPCIQGELMPIVPVDYVVKAMAHIAHKTSLEQRVFCLVDPDPPVFVDMLNSFARAANAPTFSSKLPELVLGMIPRRANAALQDIPLVANAPASIGAHMLGVPDTVLSYITSKTVFDDANTQQALRGSGIKCPALDTYAWKLWDYYARHLDPSRDPFGALKREVGNKVVVVTGSSDGIGEVLAGRLADAGARVVLVARSKEKLDRVASDITARGGKAFVQVADLSDKDSTNQAIGQIIQQHGKVDILINNAGRSIRRSVEYQTDPERFHDFTRTMDLNAYGSIRMSLGFLPLMRKQKEGQIINVSSIGVLTGPPRFGAYVASKAYVDAFSRCVSSEVAQDNVVFSTCYIPLTRTKMVVSKENKYDHVKLYTPEQSAGMIERAIVTKERKVLNSMAWWTSIAYFIFPSAVEGVLNLMYKLEPEAAPHGQRESEAAKGDKEQLRKLGALFSGAI